MESTSKAEIIANLPRQKTSEVERTTWNNWQASPKNQQKCNKTIQLFRTIALTNWGGSKETLKLYRSLIRSRLDYGCFIYGATRKTYLKELNTVHHQGLRLALGAYSTSPIESLYTEADEQPFTLRSEKLALQNSTKLKSCPSNPAYDCTFNPKYKKPFERKEKKNLLAFGRCRPYKNQKYH